MLKRTMTVRCCSKDSPSGRVTSVQSLRKKLEDARAPVVREQLSKAIAIANNDIKFINDVIKELDVFHKGLVNREQKPAPVVKENEENIFKDV